MCCSVPMTTWRACLDYDFRLPISWFWIWGFRFFASRILFYDVYACDNKFYIISAQKRLHAVAKDLRKINGVHHAMLRRLTGHSIYYVEQCLRDTLFFLTETQTRQALARQRRAPCFLWHSHSDNKCYLIYAQNRRHGFAKDLRKTNGVQHCHGVTAVFMCTCNPANTTYRAINFLRWAASAGHIIILRETQARRDPAHLRWTPCFLWPYHFYNKCHFTRNIPTALVWARAPKAIFSDTHILTINAT